MKIFKTSLSNENLVHAVMVTFAFASVVNISAYLEAHGHTLPFAIALGMAVGFGLVSISVMLSRTNRQDRLTFYTMLTTTILFGLLSGTLQTLAYSSHGLNVYLSSIFGYSFPLLMECMLAVAVSMHKDSEKRKKLEEFNEGFTEKINQKVAEVTALDSIEIDNSYVQKAIARVVKVKTDQAILALMPVQPANMPTVKHQNADEIDRHFGNADTKTQEMTAKRQNKAAIRRQKLLEILTPYDGKSSEMLNKTELAKELNVDARTIGRDLEQLENEEFISINGVVKIHSELGII